MENFNTLAIEFVVGDNAKQMMIYTLLVAEQSSALNSLVNGLMTEAQDKVFIWKDLDEQTFALFVGFFYPGGYTLRVVEYQTTRSGIVHTS